MAGEERLSPVAPIRVTTWPRVASRRGCYSTAMISSTPVPLATLEVVLERITYANEENGYTVARVAVRGSADLTTVVGTASRRSTVVYNAGAKA
jgi:hypothetical protein